MKKIFISALFLLATASLSAQLDMKTALQDKQTAAETAVKIADRILSTTHREFVNSKTGETYSTVKDTPPGHEREGGV